jgi:predicted enzyme related to lactoylglutathione lyase
MIEMASLVLFAADIGRTVAFYRAVGVLLEDEDHGEGPVHAAAEVGEVHVAVYAAQAPGRHPARRAGGSDFPGFYVDDLDAGLAAVTALGAPLLSAHERMPWGCRVVVEDPDGRAVEINDRQHCGPTA